jgi:16S rRNA (guanine966-N2)-methyltransferase
MRVIAGKLGGRQFASPKGFKTHPMSDKVRGALFNTLGDVGGLTVLDAFAGSGALSFEALSRGAATATAIDNDRSAQRTITENIRELGLTGSMKLISASVSAWLSTSDQMFDIILCDPPYNDLQLSVIDKLSSRVKLDGILVVSLPPEANLQTPEHMTELLRKSYGDAELAFYRRIS